MAGPGVQASYPGTAAAGRVGQALLCGQVPPPPLAAWRCPPEYAFFAVARCPPPTWLAGGAPLNVPALLWPGAPPHTPGWLEAPP